MLALTTVPGLSTTQLRSPWISPTRAESVAMLKQDISELNNAWRGDLFQTQSRELLERINALKEVQREEQRRQHVVMKRYASASRKAFREHFEAQRVAETAKFVQERREHIAYKARAQHRRDQQKRAIRELEAMALAEHQSVVAAATAERHDMLVSEMTEHEKTVEAGKARMAALKSRVSKAVEHARVHAENQSEVQRSDDEVAALVRLESITRLPIAEEALRGFHDISWSERRSRDELLRFLARRKQHQHAARLRSERAAVDAREDFFSTEVRNRGFIAKAQLRAFAHIVHLFQAQYDTYTELSRQHHANLLSTSRLQRNMAEDRNELVKSSVGTAMRQQAAMSDRQRAEEDRRMRTEAALSDRERRLWELREAQAERVNIAFASRFEHLEMLAQKRLQTPNGSAHPRRLMSQSLTPTPQSASVEYLPSGLRDEVIRMIREL